MRLLPTRLLSVATFVVAMLLVSCCFVMGCGVKAGSDADSEVVYEPSSRNARSSTMETANATPRYPAAIASIGGGSQAEGDTTNENGETVRVDFDPDRKIIYTAKIELVVEQFDGLEKRIQQTIEKHQGYLAKVDLDRLQGEQRHGSWTARIPVKQYQEFMDAVLDLGVPVSQRQDAQDVTEDFVDLTARITNQKKLEARILELLDRPDDKIQHVIEVERELGRVRQEIEQMEGRIRYLTDKTSMTTVNINAREERNYQPPQAPTLDNRIAAAWTNSVDNTKTTFANAVVGLVGSAIPLVLTIVGLLLFWFLIGKRLWRFMVSESGETAEANEVTETSSA